MNQITPYVEAKSWPFQEARKLLDHITRKGKKPGDLVTFETGYGPSGAPHIGTFGEVVRTLWVMRAFDELTGNAYRTRLIMFSDDYDALRKVPEGYPEWMNDHLGKPLSSIPNPYNGIDMAKANGSTFAMANNFKLSSFVDDILAIFDSSKINFSENGFKYRFMSSTQLYKNGVFNDMLDRIWDNYQAIQDVMLPSVGEERRATYSPFMPVHGKVIDRGVQLDNVRGFINYPNPFPDLDASEITSSIHDGQVKLQWKVDWAMRWTFFDVDYEMSGKDLIDSVRASGQICKILGGVPPLNLTYELFLDEHGAKISKSKGTGFTVEEWLSYGTPGSLMLFMFQNPRAAKKLYRELVPQLEDQYLKLLTKDLGPDDAPWHFTTNFQTPISGDITYALLLNLAIVSQAHSESELLGYLEQGREIAHEDKAVVSALASRVLRYAQDTGCFDRVCRPPTEQEAAAFEELAVRFEAMMPPMSAEAFQYQVYEVGKAAGFEPLRDWFKALYECLLGSSDGPRFGAFTAAYGLDNTIALLRSVKVPA